MFRSLSAVELGSAALTALLHRSGVAPETIDDVILGHCYPNSEAPAIGRVVALESGLPVSTGGQQIDRRCGSGLQAIINAVMAVTTGAADVIVAGGAESMSNVAFYSTDMRWGGARSGVAIHDGLARGRVTAGGSRYPVPGGMIETAENLAKQYAIGRAEQDALALESHRRAAAAQDSGAFAEEIVEVQISTRSGTETLARDEHIRRDASTESLAKLRPIMSRSDPEATVTAGNASGQNDAAAMCLITTRENADRSGLRPFARLLSWAVAGVPPATMGIGPVPATAKALAAAGLELKDLDLLEVNEAFAAQVLACYREWGLGAGDLERVNVNGSGISLGHPVGATGARMVCTLVRELARRDRRYGLTTMCIGGGQGLAAIWERVS